MASLLRKDWLWNIGLLFLVAAPMAYNFYRGVLPIYHGYPHGALPHPNDINFHSALTLRIVQTGSSDAWVHLWGEGAAVLRYYQNFAHLQAAAITWVTGLMPDTTVPIVNAIYLLLFPWSLWWCARKLGFSPFASAAVAFMSFFIEGDKGSAFKHLFGLQLRCWTWDGWGLYTQIVAAVWMCIGYGQAYEYMNTGRGFLLASVAIAFSWLSHLIVGYGVSVLTILIIATDLPHWRTSLLRWIKMNAFAGVCITYLVVPTMLEKHVLNRSLWEPPAYWDSYGFWNISRWLFEGKLLDSLEERELPYYTYIVLFTLVAMAAQVRRWKTDEPHLRFVLLGFVGGFLLFTGRHTFGPLVALMPFSYSLPFHRFYVQFHFFAILLAGWGMVELHRRVVDKLSALWSDARGGTEETRIDRRNVVALVMFLVMMAFFVPYVQQGYRESTFHIRNLEAQRADLDGWWGVGTAEFMDYITAAQETLPGRAYGGGIWNWGRHFTLKFLKFFSLFSCRGYSLANIGMMYHAMGLMSDMDFHFNQSRLDHHRLFNIRYFVIRVDRTEPDVRVPVGPEHGNHSVHYMPHAEGYFQLIQQHACYDAWIVGKDSAWRWREAYILGKEHTEKRHHRTALRPQERCSSTELFDDHVPLGTISSQTGHTDDFSAHVDCQEPEDSLGCTVMLKVSYHPNFRVTRASDGARMDTWAVAPSYLAFRAPPGSADTYRVVWTTPLWSKALFWFCYTLMIGGFVAHLVVGDLVAQEPSDAHKKRD